MKSFILFLIVLLLLASSAEAQWGYGTPAQYVIGQTDFSGHYAATTQAGLSGPAGVAIDLEHGKLYVGDCDNHRVLRYSYPLTANGASAEVVFGQQNFTTDDPQTYFNNTGFWPAPTAAQILYPMSLAVDHGDLWVCDEYNRRIVKYSSAWSLSTNGPDADVVLGQKDMVSRDMGVTEKYFLPWSICIDANRTLWVADPGAARILRFDSAYGLSNWAVAKQVIGQPDFTTGTLPSSPSASVIALPSSVWVDGTTLWVCDRDFNRVLRFDDAAAKGNGGTADGVLGQTTFTTNNPATTQSEFIRPYSVCVDNAGTVYVADQGNIRVMIYKKGAQKTNGASADWLLGQIGFYSFSARVDSIGFGGTYSVHQITIDTVNAKLLATDMVSARVLAYAASGTLGVRNPGTGAYPGSFILHQNFPNPFNPLTNIVYSIPKECNVSLIVYDLLGREITRLIQGTKLRGEYSITWNAANVPSGIYYYRLVAGTFVQTKKMVVMK
jgi:sugar lactone lactonase YvrE